MSKLQKLKVKIKPILKEGNVLRSFVFGSYARGDENDKSDLDLIVEFKNPQKMSLLDLVELQHKLEEKLNMSVDVLTPDSISPRIAKLIEKEKVKIL